MFHDSENDSRFLSKLNFYFQFGNETKALYYDIEVGHQNGRKQNVQKNLNSIWEYKEWDVHTNTKTKKNEKDK